jgi:hypothetical protein
MGSPGRPAADEIDVSIFPDYDLTRQVLVMNRLRDTPIPVPTVCWLDRDNQDLGTPYYVMERLPTIGTAGDFPSRYNEVLAAVALGIPISRLETRLRNEGLLTGDLDLAGFCAERIRQLLG